MLHGHGQSGGCGLTPRPINGYRSEETNDGQHIDVLEYRGEVSADQQNQISQIMGLLRTSSMRQRSALTG